MSELPEIKLRYSFDVVYYGEMGRSRRTFYDEVAAMYFAQSLSIDCNAEVTKRITMDPITKVLWSAKNITPISWTTQ